MKSQMVFIFCGLYYRVQLCRKGRWNTMYLHKALLSSVLLLLLASCQTTPTGPTVTAFPGPGKPLDAFQADDAACREWAHQQTPSRVGGGIGNIGIGGGIGGGSGGSGGFIGGGVAGSSAGEPTEYELQRRYDTAYAQCMYAKGNQVPGAPPQPYRPSPPPPTGTPQPPAPQSGPYAPQSPSSE
jgi:hypothetical protein